MQALNVVSTCRHCRYYQLEGRRGGHCQELNAFVDGGWKACQLAISPFAPVWKLDEMQTWQLETVKLCEPYSPAIQLTTAASSCAASSLPSKHFSENNISSLTASPITPLPPINRPNQKNFSIASAS
jgi:hypothetical protein